jgi:hypothetical protein
MTDTQREAFERVMNNHIKARTDERAFVRNRDGETYVYQLTNTAWFAWQAALAHSQQDAELKRIGWYSEASQKFINNDSAKLAYPNAKPVFIKAITNRKDELSESDLKNMEYGSYCSPPSTGA